MPNVVMRAPITIVVSIYGPLSQSIPNILGFGVYRGYFHPTLGSLATYISLKRAAEDRFRV